MDIQPVYTVKIKDRTFTRYIDFERMGITFKVDRPYVFSSDRGPKRATIRAEGTLEALNQLCLYLRGAVEVYDGSADPAFWGGLWSVKITHKRVTYGFTLDGMGNSINIVYILQTVNQQYSGSGSKAETGFGTDAASIADYGTKQLRLRVGNASAEGAEDTRATRLAELAYPLGTGPDFGSSGDDTYAVIEVRSLIDTLDWRFYENSTGNAAGFEQNTVISSEATQQLGYGLAFTKVQFIASSDKLVSSGADFARLPLAIGTYFFVSDTASNNKTWTVTSTPDGPGVSAVVTPTNVADEASGTANIIYVGTKIWQTLELATDNPFYATAIDIRAMRNTATDDLVVSLYSVSGGLPDTLLATATITNAGVPTFMGWVTGVLDTPTLLSFGTVYGILIERSSGTFTDGTSFNIGVDTALSYSRGSLQLDTDATNGWKARPTNADLIFKIAGEVENTIQITNIEASVGEFISAVQIDDVSGLRSTPYQDGSSTALQIIESKLEQGTSNGRQLLMKCDIDRRLIVYEAPTITAADTYLIDADGILRNRNGDPLALHKVPVGQWVKIAPLETLEGLPVAMKWRFIEEAQYDPIKNEWRPLRMRSLKGVYSVTGITQ
jgi:hypothetical protein